MIKLAVIVLLILLQFLLVFLFYKYLEDYGLIWRTGAMLLSIFAVLVIINKMENPAYKLIWVLLVMIYPLIGGIWFLSSRFRNSKGNQ